MTVRKFLVLLAIPALLIPNVVMAQAHDASVAAHQPHYYDIADFDMQPSDITYADHIAPILQQSCLQCHRPGGGQRVDGHGYDDVVAIDHIVAVQDHAVRTG